MTKNTSSQNLRFAAYILAAIPLMGVFFMLSYIIIPAYLIYLAGTSIHESFKNKPEKPKNDSPYSNIVARTILARNLHREVQYTIQARINRNAPVNPERLLRQHGFHRVRRHAVVRREGDNRAINSTNGDNINERTSYHRASSRGNRR